MDDKYEHVLALNRARQARWREQNKEQIAEKRRADRSELIALRAHVAELNAVAPDVPVAVVPPAKRDRKGAVVWDQPTVMAKLKELDINLNTKAKYVGDIKAVFQLTSCLDLAKCLKNFAAIKATIETGNLISNPNKQYAVSSQKGFVQSILYVIDKLNIPLPATIKQQYVDLLGAYKIKTTDQTEARKRDPNFDVMPYTEYMTQIKEAYGADSKQYLIASLYDEVTVRDDFDLVILGSVRDKQNETQNYLIVPPNERNRVTVIIQHHKTDKLRGDIKVVLSARLSKLVRTYMLKNELTVGNKLFTDNHTGLSGYVATMNRRIGARAGINYIRQSKISEILSEQGLSAEDKQTLAKAMGHTAICQLKYIRGLQAELT